jgi:dihydroxyacetone kinase-like predicted kinase
VVGDERLLRVHVHTMSPDEILNCARSKGTLIDIVVEDMDQQVREKRWRVERSDNKHPNE